MHHPTDRITHTTAFVTASRGALAGTRNSSVGPPHEGSIRRPIASVQDSELIVMLVVDERRRGVVTLHLPNEL